MSISVAELKLDQISKDIKWRAVSLPGHQIHEPWVREFFRQRANAFRSELVKIPINLEEEVIFDLGSPSPIGSCVMSLVQQANQPLLSHLGHKVGIEIGPEDIAVSVFCVVKQYKAANSNRLRAPVFEYHECVISVIRRKGRDFGVYLIGENGTRELFYTIQPLSRLKADKPLSYYIGLPASRFYGLNSSFPVIHKGEWRAARYGTRALLPIVSRTGDRCFLGSRLQIGYLKALSTESFPSARWLHVALNSGRPSKHYDRSSNRQGYCVNLCSAAAVAGVTAAAAATGKCAVTLGALAGLPGEIACALFGAAGILGSLVGGLLCVDQCDGDTDNSQPSNLVGVNAEGEPDEQENETAGEYDGEENGINHDAGGEDNSLPTFETKDPWDWA